MKEILSRIGEFEYIKTVIFDEEIILHVSCIFSFETCNVQFFEEF